MPQKLCICQICNCGRHRCPHSPARLFNDPGIPCTMSEYESRYTGDMGEKVASFRPQYKAYREPETPMANQSTQRHDFVPHQLHSQPDFKPLQVYEEPTLAMDLSSTYHTEFPVKEGGKAVSYKPKQRKIGGGVFRGDATYDANCKIADYKEWPIGRRVAVLPQNAMPDMSAYKFGNKTEAETHYIYHPDGKAAESAKPPQGADICTEPFVSQTSHQTDFIKKEIPGKHCRPKTIYQPPTIPHDMLSTYNNNYRGEPGEVVGSFRPTNPCYRYSGDPTGSTTHRSDFVPLPLVEKEPRKGATYEPCNVLMDLNTTNQIDYRYFKDYERADSFKPKQRRIGGGTFTELFDERGCIPSTGDSTNHHDYIIHPIVARIPLKRRSSEGFLLGEDSPTYLTTLKDDYRGLNGTGWVKSRVFGKGVNQAEDHVNLGDVELNGRTMMSTNHHDYPKHIIGCVGQPLPDHEGFVIGDENMAPEYLSSTQAQYNARTASGPSASGTKGVRNGRDLFRSSSGLLFAATDQSNTSLTTSTSHFRGNLGKAAGIPSGKPRQGTSQDFALGQDPPVHTTTTGDAYKDTSLFYGHKPPQRVNRDLFQPSDDFMLDYYGPTLRRSSQTAIRARRRGLLSSGRRQKRSSTEEAIPGRNAPAGIPSQTNQMPEYPSAQQEHEFNNGGQIPERSRLMWEDLHRKASVDSAGFLWFPLPHKPRQSSRTDVYPLPNWAETALKEAGTVEGGTLRPSSDEGVSVGMHIPRAGSISSRKHHRRSRVQDKDSMESGRHSYSPRSLDGFNSADSLNDTRPGTPVANAVRKSRSRAGPSPAEIITDTVGGNSGAMPTPKLISISDLKKKQDGSEAERNPLAAEDAAITVSKDSKVLDPTAVAAGTHKSSATSSEEESNAGQAGRKGRRLLKNRRSRRNQYPRSTSLGPTMNQGYREQTTTTQQDYPPQDKQTGKQATRITRSTKKAREANNIYEVTSVPVQHSPRSIRPEVISKRVNPAPSPERPASPHVSNVTSYDSTAGHPPEDTAITSATVKNEEDLMGKDLAEAAKNDDRRPKPLKRAPSGNWTFVPNEPFRPSDSLRFDTSEKFSSQTTSGQDYQPPLLSPADPSRAVSMDRKNLRSQLGQLMADPSYDLAESELKRPKRSSSLGPLEKGLGVRVKPIVHADHKIFEEDGSYRGATTEMQDAFRRNGQGDGRREMIIPNDSIDYLGHSGKDIPFPPSSAQDAFSAVFLTDARQALFEPKETLQLFDKEAPFSLGREKGMPQANLLDQRRQPIKPRNHANILSQDLLNLKVGQTVNQDTYQDVSGLDGRPSMIRPSETRDPLGASRDVEQTDLGSSTNQEAYKYRGKEVSRPLPIKQRSTEGLLNDVHAQHEWQTSNQDTYESTGKTMADSRRQPFRPLHNGNILTTEQHEKTAFPHSEMQDSYPAYLFRRNDARGTDYEEDNLATADNYSFVGADGKFNRTLPLVPHENDDLLLQHLAADGTNDWRTVSRDVHTNFPSQRVRAVSIRPRDQREPVADPHPTGRTTTQTDFQHVLSAPPPLPFLPRKNYDLLNQDQTLSGPSRSVSQDAYQKLEGSRVERGVRKRSTENLLGDTAEGRAIGRSEQQDAYDTIAHPSRSRVFPIRPRSATVIFDGRSQDRFGLSVTQDAYGDIGQLEREAARAMAAPPAKDHAIFSYHSPFTDTTESHDAFQGRVDPGGTRLPIVPSDRDSICPRDAHLAAYDQTQNSRTYKVPPHGFNGRQNALRPKSSDNLFGEKTELLDEHRRTVAQDAYQDHTKLLQSSADQREEKSRRRMEEQREGESVVTVRGNRVQSGRSVKSAGSSSRSAEKRGLFNKDTNVLPPLAHHKSSENLYVRSPFFDTTTSHDAYTNPGPFHPSIPIRRRSSSGVFAPATGDFIPALTTTSQSAFVAHATHQRRQQVRSLRIDDNVTFGSADSQPFKTFGKTTNQEAFPNYANLPHILDEFHGSHHADAFRSSLNRSFGAAHADVTPLLTTSQLFYKRHEVTGESAGVVQPDRVARLNPVTGQVQLFQSVREVEGKRSRLIPISGQMCPAELLESGEADWDFLGEENGHLFYDIDR